MTFIPRQQEKHCFIACSEDKVNAGLCDCINRMKNEALRQPLVLAAVPDRKDMDYTKVMAIGKEKYCIKGISCNFCDFMDREAGKINSCVQEYVKRHCS